MNFPLDIRSFDYNREFSQSSNFYFRQNLSQTDQMSTTSQRTQQNQNSKGKHLTQKEIKELPVLIYSEKRKIWFKDLSIDSTCSICQNEYKVKDKLHQLICQHFFHQQCLDTWLKIGNTCPVCRTICNDEKKLGKNIKVLKFGCKLELIFDQLVQIKGKLKGWTRIFVNRKNLLKKANQLDRELNTVIDEMDLIGNKTQRTKENIVKSQKLQKEIEEIKSLM